jgi:hypothetical protein
MPHRWDPIAPPVSGQRILEAYARAGPRALVTGWAALRLAGGNFFDGLARDGATRLPVTLAANGERLGTGHGAVVVEDRVPDDQVVVLHGIRCARAERALYDEMQRIGEVREMAVAVGAACAAQLTSVKRMRRYAATRRWYRDVRLVKEAIEMSVEGCRSPQEDRFRQLWEYDAGWGRPLINRTVDPARGVVGEYAGADHRDIDRHEADVDREADLRDVGLEYVEVVGRTLRDPYRVITRMEAAAARRDPGPSRPVKLPSDSSRRGSHTGLDGKPRHRSAHHATRAARASSSDIGPWSIRSSSRNL